MVPLRKHWESTSVIGCSVFVVNHDWLQLQLQSKMAEVLTQSGPQVVFHTPRNIKVASCLILIVTIHGISGLSSRFGKSQSVSQRVIWQCLAMCGNVSVESREITR